MSLTLTETTNSCNGLESTFTATGTVITVQESIEKSKKERRRRQWRESKRKSRGRTYGDDQSKEHQDRKKAKARHDAAKLRQGRTDEQKRECRSKHQRGLITYYLTD